MTQDELWMNKWQEAVDFLETYHRRPSKFVLEERDMYGVCAKGNRGETSRHPLPCGFGNPEMPAILR